MLVLQFSRIQILSFTKERRSNTCHMLNIVHAPECTSSVFIGTNTLITFFLIAFNCMLISLTTSQRKCQVIVFSEFECNWCSSRKRKLINRFLKFQQNRSVPLVFISCANVSVTILATKRVHLATF